MPHPTIAVGLAVAAAAVLAAGCGGPHPVDSVGSATPLSTTHATRDAIATPVRTATDLADRLRDQALVPRRAVRASHAPTSALRQPPSLPGVRGVVVREIWWRIDEPAATAYRWVSRHQSRLLEPESSSSTGGPTTADVSQVANFGQRQSLPPTVNSAALSIEVVPVTAQSSALGAFAVVVRQPPRPAAEDVPLTVRSVSISTRAVFEPKISGVHRDITLTGAAARRTVRDFDALVVQPPGGTYACPTELDVTTLTFASPGHVWRAVVGDCAGITVTLNGRALPPLQGSVALGRDTSGGIGSRSGVRGPISSVTTPTIGNRPIAVPTLQSSTR